MLRRNRGEGLLTDMLGVLHAPTHLGRIVWGWEGIFLASTWACLSVEDLCGSTIDL